MSNPKQVKITPVDLHSEAITSSEANPLLTGLALIPVELYGSLVSVQERLRRVDPRHIYNHPNNFHITIKPIGILGDQVEPRNLSRIVKVMSTVASETEPFDVGLGGLSVFPDAVYVNVSKGRKDIVRLNEALSKGLKEMVVRGRYEGANMIPHVTLLHFAVPDVDDLLMEVKKAKRLNFGVMTLERIALVKVSLRTYFGPQSMKARAFEKVAIFPLGSSALSSHRSAS